MYLLKKIGRCLCLPPPSHPNPSPIPTHPFLSPPPNVLQPLLICGPSLDRSSDLLICQAGGLAGTAVDVALFPLDTIKTRLQSSRGFWASGGFRRIYAGIIPAASASAPSGGCDHAPLCDHAPPTLTDPVTHLL